jgi:hypothetical protein
MLFVDNMFADVFLPEAPNSEQRFRHDHAKQHLINCASGTSAAKFQRIRVPVLSESRRTSSVP